MHPRRTPLLSIVVILVAAWTAKADDKDAIEKLKMENAELRKQLELERAVAANERKARLVAEDAEKLAEAKRQLAEVQQRRADAESKVAAERAQIAVLAQKLAELAAKNAEDRGVEAKRQLEIEQVQRAKALEEAVRSKERAVQLEVELKTHQKRFLELEKRIVELEKSRQPRDKAPEDRKPLANIRGKIIQVEASGLVMLSVGVDAGLAVGDSLDVYRLANDSKNPKYLGKVILVRAEPKQAVGRFSGVDKNSQPVVGDMVSSGVGENR